MRIRMFFMAILAAFSSILNSNPVLAQTNDFSLTVTPAPLVTTLKPGTQTSLDLKIRNSGTGLEKLKIEPKAFKVDESGQVKVDEAAPSEIAAWIKFKEPQFIIKAGEWYTQKLIISLPKDAGFSYSFALMISRVQDPTAEPGTRMIRGSVVLFALINVDRPGATKKLEVQKFSTSAGIYEYLPAKIDIKFKNTGNTIVLPYGNIYIQRGSKDKNPIATLPVNEKGGYIIPGSVRLLSTDWKDGFPRFDTQSSSEGTQQKSEVWDWSQLTKFRIGQYSAKLVAVYNDGQRDVPIEQEVSFWVLPWKIILVALIAMAILLFGLWSLLRKVLKFLRRKK